MKPERSAGSSAERGGRRRRFWSNDEKRRMIAESLEPGASVSKVAQRYGVNANLLFTWRRWASGRSANGETEPVKLLPVTVAAEAQTASPSPVAAAEPIGRMEIVLSGGARIIVGADVDATALARVVKALTRR